MKTQNISSLFVSVLAFVVFFGAASVISAWTGPTVTPPSGNISTPVNLTSTSQVKSGGFWASAIGSTAGYCINGSCISTWPVFPWTPNANGVSYMGGNVGIGTASPVAKLDINGYMRLATNTSAPLCNTNRTGAIALTEGALVCICNGTSWIFDYNGSACVWASTAGSQTYSTPGNYSFTVPIYNSLTVTVWGGGGGGSEWQFGGSGGQSSWNSAVIAGGGRGGAAGVGGGTASGGDINTSGAAGSGQNGGASPNGGAGGIYPSSQSGVTPGGGGAGEGGGGGGGAYSRKTYSAGALSVGANISVVVGTSGAAGGGGGSGPGAPGRVTITWD